MNVHVEDISAVQKKVVVELSVPEVDEALEEQYRRLSRTARVKGFRPGHVPKSLLRKMFRQDATQSAMSAILKANLWTALQQAAVMPVSVPDIEPSELAEGQPFTFSMFCQVRPSIDLKGIDELRAERKPVEVPDDAILKEIEALRQQHAQLEAVEDRGADIGDVVTMDYVGTLVGATEPFDGGTGTDRQIELGSGSLVPGFEDQLQGAREGEERTLNISFPESYSGDLAGKEATFKVTVKAVQKKILSDVDDDFAKDLDYEDLSAMRAAIYDKLATKLEEEAGGDLREQVVKGLLSANPIEIPPILLESAVDRMRRNLTLQMAMSGLDKELTAQLMESQDGAIREKARELAHRDLLLDEVCKRENLIVTEEDLEVRIGEIAERAGQPKAKVKANLQKDDRIEGLRSEMQHLKALEWLEQKAQANAAAALGAEA